MMGLSWQTSPSNRPIEHCSRPFQHYRHRADHACRSDSIRSIAAGDDLQRLIRQRPLQPQSLLHRGIEPRVELVLGGEDHRHGLRMDRLDLGIRLAGQKAVEQVLTLDRLGFGAARAGPRSPDAGEGRERPLLGQGKPGRGLAWLGVFILTEAGEWHEAAVLRLEPATPIGALSVADIRHRRAVDVRR